MLANIYLDVFDREMLGRGYPLVRYVDDWIFPAASEREARLGLSAAEAVLSLLRISLNKEKSGVVDLRRERVVFLGHALSADRVDAAPKAWERVRAAAEAYRNAPNEAERRHAHVCVTCGRFTGRRACPSVGETMCRGKVCLRSAVCFTGKTVPEKMRLVKDCSYPVRWARTFNGKLAKERK